MEQNELIVIEALKPEIVFGEKQELEKLLGGLESTVRKIPVDISTSGGRAACKSLAYKVTRSKTALDEMGKEFVAHLKKAASLVDVDRRSIRDRLDALKDEVRKPLDEWEATEERRIDGHEKAIIDMIALATLSGEPAVADIESRIGKLNDSLDRDWQEFAKRAADTRAASLMSLREALAAAVTRDADRAELERLRRENADRLDREIREKTEQDRRDREARIAAKAAEDARLEAERKAAEREKQAAADRERAEQDRLAAIARAERAAADAKADADRAAAESRAAEERAARDREAAIEAERKRVKDQKAAEEAALAARESDRAHKAKVHNAIVDALAADGVLRDAGVQVVKAIAQGHVPYLKIAY